MGEVLHKPTLAVPSPHYKPDRVVCNGRCEALDLALVVVGVVAEEVAARVAPAEGQTMLDNLVEWNPLNTADPEKTAVIYAGFPINRANFYCRLGLDKVAIISGLPY